MDEALGSDDAKFQPLLFDNVYFDAVTFLGVKFLWNQVLVGTAFQNHMNNLPYAACTLVDFLIFYFYLSPNVSLTNPKLDLLFIVGVTILLSLNSLPPEDSHPDSKKTNCLYRALGAYFAMGTYYTNDSTFLCNSLWAFNDYLLAVLYIPQIQFNLRENSLTYDHYKIIMFVCKAMYIVAWIFDRKIFSRLALVPQFFLSIHFLWNTLPRLKRCNRYLSNAMRRRDNN